MLDSSVRVWNYVEGRCVKTYQAGGYRNAKWSLQGAWGAYDDGEEDEAVIEKESGGHKRAMLLSGSEDGSVFLWDVNSKAVLQRLVGHDGVVMGVDVHPAENMIVSCGMDRTIRIWRDEGERKTVGLEN